MTIVLLGIGVFLGTFAIVFFAVNYWYWRGYDDGQKELFDRGWRGP